MVGRVPVQRGREETHSPQRGNRTRTKAVVLPEWIERWISPLPRQSLMAAMLLLPISFSLSCFALTQIFPQVAR